MRQFRFQLSVWLAVLVLAAVPWLTQAQFGGYFNSQTGTTKQLLDKFLGQLEKLGGSYGKGTVLYKQMENMIRLNSAMNTGQIFRCQIFHAAEVRGGVLLGEQFLCVYANMLYGYESSNAFIEVYFDDTLAATVKKLNPAMANTRIFFRLAAAQNNKLKLLMNTDIPNHSDYQFIQGVELPVQESYLIRFKFYPGFTGAQVAEDATYRLYLAPEALDDLKNNPPGVAGDDGPPTPTTQGASLTISLNLKRGWNLVSVPTQPVSVADLEGCQSTGRFLAYSPLKQNSPYAAVARLDPLKGYWVRSAERCTLTANLTKEPAQPSQLNLKPGWNLISSADGKLTVRQLQAACQVQGPVYWYDGSRYQTTSSSLQAEKGYWVEVGQSCVVNL